jgi:hypothetical protein
MGFKLGSSKGFKATSGNIKTKLSFGKKHSTSIPGVPIIPMPLEKGVLGEANMDGSIYISDKIEPGSAEERQVINHEMRHATDMKLGKLAYDDDSVTYNGKVYPRKDVNGVDSILIDGEWKEAGTHDFPWEVDANNGDKNGGI